LVEDRMPERSILDVLTQTAFWLRWHRHFGPLSGSDPKLADPLARYVVITFTYGTNMGPYQASRHLRGLVSPHEISAPANQHITPAKLNLASTDVINEYARLDLTKLWGDGSQVATDGTQMDTWADNLLAESHIRYGGYGGIAFRHVSDTYIALFSHPGADAAGLRPSRDAGPRPAPADPELAGPDLLPARSRDQVRAHRRPVR
jgi:hypothetical protein